MKKLCLGVNFRIFRRRKIFTSFVAVICLFVVLCIVDKSNLYDFCQISFDHAAQHYVAPGLIKMEVAESRRQNRNLQHLYPRKQSANGISEEKNVLSKSDTSLEWTDKQRIYKDTALSAADHNTLHLKARDYSDSNKTMDTRPTKKLPQAIIIGVKKCGTRALLEFLRAHPDVKATGPEPHFFDKNYEKGLEWYRNMMPPTYQSQMTIEKTPGYYVTKDGARRLYNMSKSVKLIIVVRDPVTRAISDYAQVTSKTTKPKSFENLLFLNNDTRVIDTSWKIVRIGIYVEHLYQWFKYFPREQIHFVHGEKLISDPGVEMIKVQKFLGLRKMITHDNFIMNKTRGFPCIKKTWKSKKGRCLDRTKGRKHPYIRPDVLQQLRDFYRPFNAKFYESVGIDFHWS